MGAAAAVTAAVLLAVGVAVTGLRHLAPLVGGQAAEVQGSVPPPTTNPGTVVAGVIVDPSGSNGGPRGAAQAMRELAAVVSSWPGVAPTQGSPAEAVPGLDLTVRQVARNSYAASAGVAHVNIPAIPAVPAPPSDDTDVAAAGAYLRHLATVREAWTTARQEASAAASLLSGMRLPAEDSEIAGAVSALAQVLPRSPTPRAVVIISDLEQAGAAAQVDGDLTNTVVTVFQRCDRGAARCQAARESLTRLTSTLNGPPPVFERIEALPRGLGDALRGH